MQLQPVKLIALRNLTYLLKYKTLCRIFALGAGIALRSPNERGETGQ
jgi:hypothetical protein